MPVDRMTHPREGHSRKLTALSDFEFRVWYQYRQSADDFGVMRFSALTIQDGNLSLAKRPADQVIKALQRCVEIGLLLQFRDQDSLFVCSPMWQDVQKITYPRDTILPAPPSTVLEKCSQSSLELFRIHPSLRKGKKKSLKLARVRARQTANANGCTDPIDHEQSFETFFWRKYPRKVARKSALKEWLRIAPSVELQAEIAAALDRHIASDAWSKATPEFLPHGRTWLHNERWKDELPTNGNGNGSHGGGHTPAAASKYAGIEEADE